MLTLIHHPTSVGVGEDAKTLRQQERSAALNRTLSVRMSRNVALSGLHERIADCSEDNWDGYGAAAVSIDSVLLARCIITGLPPELPNPEVDVDPEGDIILEWYRSPRRVFSIAVGGDGELHYAGLFGYNKVHGTEYFADVLPRSILEGLRRHLP